MATLVDLGGDTLIVNDIQTGATAPGQTGTSMAASNSVTGGFTALSGTATTAGGATTAALTMGSGPGPSIYFGSGAPTITAKQGSIYLRTDGSSTSTRLYVNTTGSTTWTNFTSAA